VEIRDGQGNYYGRAESTPLNGYLPPDGWPTGQMLRDPLPVRVLPGTPPGRYRVEIEAVWLERNEALGIRDTQRGYGTQMAVAEIEVTRPASPAATENDLGVAHRLDAPLALAGGGPALLGYDAALPPEARPGDGLPVALLWRAGDGPAGGPQLHLELQAGSQRYRRAEGHPLGGSYAAAQWQPGELVRDAWEALLPADAPGGPYRAALVIQAPGGPEQRLDLGEVRIQARAHSFQPPHPSSEQAVDFGGVGSLLGYDMPSGVRPGDTLAMTLYWRAAGPAPRSYVRFLHLLDAAGQIRAQHDSVPGDGTLPTTGWLAGEVLADRVQIALPADLPPGQYVLLLGMYNPATGARLADAGGKDAVLLGQALQVR
jgi:hypothetical protein